MTIQEILALSPEQQIAAVERGDISDAVVHTLPLDTAFENFSVEIAGNFFACIYGSDTNVNANVQFNKVEPNNQNALTFTQGLAVIRPFARFYVSADAQAGKVIKFLIATSYPLFGIQDNRSNNVQSQYLATIADQMQGQTAAGNFAADYSVTGIQKVISSAAATRAAFIFADKANTDNVYIGFDGSTTATKKVITLSPGESFGVDDYRGDFYAIAASGTQKISASTW